LAFKIAARALLELGKELISSDEVALYELIKNAVDAKSPSIELDVRIVLSHSAYMAALDAIDDAIEKEEEFSKTDLVRQLRSSIDTSASPEWIEAFLADIDSADDDELRDALVAAYKNHNSIKVIDEGHGMSFKELGDVFLTVGTRSRRAQNMSGAEYLGDKGVGRLSTMRLGDHLRVSTTRSNDEYFNVLDIDWSAFSHDSELEVSDIPVAPHRGKRKTDSRFQGTTLRIGQLSSDWSADRFSEMLSGKVARMVDPFEKGRANRLITARYNSKRFLIPSIPDQLLRAAHATCQLRFEINKGEPVLNGKMNYRLRNAARDVRQKGAEVLSIAQRVFRRRGKTGHAANSATPLRLKALQALGAFDVEIYWYNRRIVEAVEGLTQKKQQTQAEIRRWAGGPMLFRRGFRILPYGEPGDDWLELDKNAFGQTGFKLNRQQVIGRVRVTAGHAALSEQTNREGLVQSDARDALRIILMWLLHNEFRGLINEADKAHALKERKDRLASVDLANAEQAAREQFAVLRRTAGPAAIPTITRLEGLFGKLTQTVQTVMEVAAKDAATAKTDREKFVQLAGIGLMTEFIFHELDRAVSHTLRLLSERQGNEKVSLSALEEQLKTLQKRVSAFDEFTGERRQTKSSFDAREVVGTVLDNHANQFKRHGIRVVLKANRPFKIRAVKGMLIQIIENLVSNSVYWLKTQKRIESGFKPELVVSVDPEAESIVVADNGPGVDPSRAEIIFQAFITSKPPGEGRGLGLFISRELAEYHGWRIEMDKQPNLYRPGRLNAFVLDMDEQHE